MLIWFLNWEITVSVKGILNGSYPLVCIPECRPGACIQLEEGWGSKGLRNILAHHQNFAQHQVVGTEAAHSPFQMPSAKLGPVTG